MDLNKDTKEIYSIDSESYSEYMRHSSKESSSFLDTIIKLLLMVLIVVFSYFFYYIVKKDLSFGDIFNKKELQAALNFFEQKEELNKEEDYVEVLAKGVVKNENTPEKTIVMGVNTVMDSKEEVTETPNEKHVQKVEKKSTTLSNTYLELMTKELNSGTLK